MTDAVIVDLKNAKFYEIVIRGTQDTSRGLEASLSCFSPPPLKYIVDETILCFFVPVKTPFYAYKCRKCVVKFPTFWNPDMILHFCSDDRLRSLTDFEAKSQVGVGAGTSGSRIAPLYLKNEKFTIGDGCIEG